jgi:CCGSCS motif protein
MELSVKKAFGNKETETESAQSQEAKLKEESTTASSTENKKDDEPTSCCGSCSG